MCPPLHVHSGFQRAVSNPQKQIPVIPSTLRILTNYNSCWILVLLPFHQPLKTDYSLLNTTSMTGSHLRDLCVSCSSHCCTLHWKTLNPVRKKWLLMGKASGYTTTVWLNVYDITHNRNPCLNSCNVFNQLPDGREMGEQPLIPEARARQVCTQIYMMRELKMNPGAFL